jgi:hypothetical protein
MDTFRSYSGYYRGRFFICLYATFIHIENISRLVKKFIFGHYILHHIKNVSTFLLAHSLSSSYRKASAWRTLSSGFLRKRDFNQSHPAVSVSSLKLLEIPSALASLRAVARTEILSRAKPAAESA